MKTSKKDLNDLLIRVGQLSDLPTSGRQAETEQAEKYLYLEYAPVYGGYRIVLVKVTTGGHYGAFGGNGCEARIPAGVMAVKLKGIISGLYFKI